MLHFITSIITLKTVLENRIVECQMVGNVAEGTGLAYIAHALGDDKEQALTLVHLASGTHIGGSWQTPDEQQAQYWIESLHEIADWTEPVPVIRSGKTFHTLHLAAVGVLLEMVKCEEGDADETSA